MDEPARVIPTLLASERAIPNNYNASLRLAQMENEAKRYDDAVAAYDRGLAHVTGPAGRTWLLEIRVEALVGKGDTATALRVLEEAMKSARAIGTEEMRANHIRRITRAIAEISNKQ